MARKKTEAYNATCLHCKSPSVSRGACQYHYAMGRKMVLSGEATDEELVAIGWLLPKKDRGGFKAEMEGKLAQLRGSLPKSDGRERETETSGLNTRLRDNREVSRRGEAEAKSEVCNDLTIPPVC